MIPFTTFFYTNRNVAAYGNEKSLNSNTIKWEKLIINYKTDNNTDRKWEVVDDENILNHKVWETDEIEKFIENNNPKNFYSLNRAIIFGDNNSGPDVSFLVPLGFKSFDRYKLDFSIRGWNRRPINSNLFAWNGGDAVAQINYPIFNEKNSSFAINIGFRSIYTGDMPGGNSPLGEGSSLGFRWDRKISNNSGIAFGAEQLIHFDNKTDTGRDIYIAYSKGKILSEKNSYPLAIFTGGIGTGYLALWEKTQFSCSDLFGGAGVDVNNYKQLCWGPFSALSIVFNEKFSNFIEYNNYSLMIGSSYSPSNKVRITFGLTFAESFDDYNIKNFDNLRWFSRFTITI